MGFSDMGKFNISLLAKQSWRILSNPDSLVAKTFKATYFPMTDFLTAPLGNNPSYIWKSIWATRDVLLKRSCWRVGKRDLIRVKEDAWILSGVNFKLSHAISQLPNFYVSTFIDANL